MGTIRGVLRYNECKEDREMVEGKVWDTVKQKQGKGCSVVRNASLGLIVSILGPCLEMLLPFLK